MAESCGTGARAVGRLGRGGVGSHEHALALSRAGLGQPCGLPVAWYR
jgi:hypothetical protein